MLPHGTPTGYAYPSLVLLHAVRNKYCEQGCWHIRMFCEGILNRVRVDESRFECLQVDLMHSQRLYTCTEDTGDKEGCYCTHRTNHWTPLQRTENSARQSCTNIVETRDPICTLLYASQHTKNQRREQTERRGRSIHAESTIRALLRALSPEVDPLLHSLNVPLLRDRDPKRVRLVGSGQNLDALSPHGVPAIEEQERFFFTGGVVGGVRLDAELCLACEGEECGRGHKDVLEGALGVEVQVAGLHDTLRSI